MNELMLKVNQNPGSIELNFDELEAQLDAKLAEYKGAVFAEDSKDIAKKEVASLRRLKKDIDDARKAVKKEWMKPYEVFEQRMKRLSGKVDEPILLIDGQVKEFEERRRTEKRRKIQEAYRELIAPIPDYAIYMPLEKIYDSKWENASTSMKAINKALLEKIEGIIAAVNTIKSMNSDKEEESLEMYKRTLDMPKALSVISEYEKHKDEILRQEEEKRQKEEERRREVEIERARAAEREAIAREEQIRKEERERTLLKKTPQTALPEPTDFDEAELPFEQPTTITAFYKVVATSQELEQVEMAFNSIGIYFERRDA